MHIGKFGLRARTKDNLLLAMHGTFWFEIADPNLARKVGFEFPPSKWTWLHNRRERKAISNVCEYLRNLVISATLQLFREKSAYEVRNNLSLVEARLIELLKTSATLRENGLAITNLSIEGIYEVKEEAALERFPSRTEVNKKSSALGFLARINRAKVALIIVLIALFALMVYSCSRGFLIANYPDIHGENYGKLEYTYHQIWGDSVQVYAYISVTKTDEPEPFQGDINVLLIDSQGKPSNVVYNRTMRLIEPIYINDSISYYNTSVSIVTTPIKNVVTIGDDFSFNLNINAEDDLLFDYYPYISEERPKLPLKTGSNNMSVHISFLEGEEPYLVIMSYMLDYEDRTYNLTRQIAFGNPALFRLRFYKNMTGEIHYLDWSRYDIWLLPFSGSVAQERRIEVENGSLVCTFPLNISLSADKMVFTRYLSIGDCYVVDMNAITICFSPPVTVPAMSFLIIVYTLYRKWQGLILHLSKYKIFYMSLLVASLLVTCQYFQVFSDLVPYLIDFLVLGVICFGFMSIGVVRNRFSNNEYKVFWKNTILLMISLPLLLLPVWIYHTISTGDLGLFLRLFPSVLTVSLFVLLGAGLVGMMVTFLFSFSAGFFLFVVHIVLKMWNRIQRRPEPPAFCVDVSVRADTGILKLKSFPYYISELFIFSIWFVILFSSSAPISIKDLWETIMETNSLVFLIPLYACAYLLFLYELLRITRLKKGKRRKKEEEEELIGPRLLHKLWSTFALIVFVAKMLWEGLNPGILSSFVAMFYFVLLISSGFAIGFIGISKIALNRASKEMERIQKRYSGIVFQ